MEYFRSNNAACLFWMLLLLCFVSTAGVAGDIGLLDIDTIMAIPEDGFLSAVGDPNSIALMIPALKESQAISSLVKAYSQGKEEKHARRLALVLYLFSLEYKSIRGYAAAGMEMLFVQGYLTVKDTAAVKKLSREMNVDVAKAIEVDLIRSMVDYVLHRPEDNHTLKAIAGDIAEIGLIGRAINEPEYVRATYRYLCGFHGYGHDGFGGGFTFDMHSDQGPKRHLEAVKHVKSVLAAIEGYSDPVGYKDKDGVRLDDVSLADFPYLERMLAVLGEYTLPDGQLNLIGESDAAKVSTPLVESRNVLLAGFGHAVLGGGKGAKQSQVQLHFSEHYANETHKDCLSMVWYGHGRQMSGEMGEQLNKLRAWSSSTLAHNTVVVDRQSQNGYGGFGNVEMFVSDVKGLSAIRVDGTKAYGDLGVKKYRRTIIHNTVDENHPYFVDVFEVEGGAVHDYSIHGSAIGDMTGKCSLKMVRMDGERPMLEDGEVWAEPGDVNSGFKFLSSEYGLITDIDKSQAYKNFNVTFGYKKDKSVGTRIHMLADPSMEVFLGTSPGLHLAASHNDDKVYDWKMPHLIARRSGEKGLKSTFVAVYDICKDGPKIKSVKRLTSSDAYIALEITLDGRVDKLFYCSQGARSMIGGTVQMKGQLGLVCEKDDCLDGYLIEGTLLRKSPMMIRAKKSSYAGRILTESRKGEGGPGNCFTVNIILPTGTDLRDKWMIVTHSPLAGIGELIEKIEGHRGTHAYQIDRVEREGAKMVVYLKEDHGLDIDGDTTTELFSPWRVFAGANRFVIHTHAEGVSR